MKTTQMQSCVHENGTVECTLVEVELPEPGPDEVMVEIEAAPINPSDLGLMFGAADLSTVRVTERDGQLVGRERPVCWNVHASDEHRRHEGEEVGLCREHPSYICHQGFWVD